ncbi:MAG TPA: LLM class flavin-dependent oxidoreductase [Gemmatales bacterium]|nr:LLM class flavin-dependent oxidoreductase [Gemmatales bacterium]HMP60379.1 LLM class flavin-dependent oxidoreductase [Gemmatales bacterium]
MEIYFSQSLSWPSLPADFTAKHESAWVIGSNRLYERGPGAELIRSGLDVLLTAESAGADGLCFVEHHATPRGLVPAASILAAAAAARTSRVRVAVLGLGTAVQTTPLHVAEALALLDAVTGGRLVVGFDMTQGPDYFAQQVDPTLAQERFREGLRLVLDAWDKPGPFTWHSKHFFVRNVNLWPLPQQRPGPPVWVVDPLAAQTRSLAVRRGLTLLAPLFGGAAAARHSFEAMRGVAAAEGTEKPLRLGWSVPVYVGASDDQARAEFEPHWRYLTTQLMHGYGRMTPPGLLQPQERLDLIKRSREQPSAVRGWDEILDGGWAVVGGSATVRDRLRHWQKEFGPSVLLLDVQLGSLPAELARASIERLGQEVLPAMRTSGS